MLNFLNIFSKKPKFAIQTEHKVEKVFSVGGKDFYAFSNEFKIPASRAMAAQDVYDELEMRVDKAYLESYLSALKSALNKGNLVQIAQMTAMLEDRMKYITSVDALYKLAAVRYLWEGENPYSFDMAEASQKIAFWKKHQKSIDDFFLATPMRDYVPYFLQSEMSLEAYFGLTNQDTLQALKYHFSVLSENGSESEKLSLLEQQIQALEVLMK